MKALFCIAFLAACAVADPSVTGTVVAVSKLPDSTLSTVRAGKDQIAANATCAFVDKTGTVVSADCEVVTIGDSTTTVKSRSMQMDDVKRSPVVRFTNP